MGLSTDDRIMHWNFGEGRITAVPHSIDDVPWEWAHDWDSVIQVEFIFGSLPVREWVVAQDCDLLHATTKFVATNS